LHKKTETEQPNQPPPQTTKQKTPPTQPAVAAPLTLTAYLKTEQALWYWTTLATSAATTIAILTIPPDLNPWKYVRITLSLIYILWLPGYTITKNLFPQNTHNLDPIMRAILNIALSITLVPIIALLLNYTPWGITLTPMTLSLLTLTLTSATTAIIREQQTQNKQNTKTKT